MPNEDSPSPPPRPPGSCEYPPAAPGPPSCPRLRAPDTAGYRRIAPRPTEIQMTELGPADALLAFIKVPEIHTVSSRTVLVVRDHEGRESVHKKTGKARWRESEKNRLRENARNAEPARRRRRNMSAEERERINKKRRLQRQMKKNLPKKDAYGILQPFLKKHGEEGLVNYCKSTLSIRTYHEIREDLHLSTTPPNQQSGSDSR